MDKDSKHTFKVLAKWLKDNKVKVLEGPSQSPDLNPIRDLWAGLKKVCVSQDAYKPGQFCQEEWAKIPATYSENLVEGYLKCLTQV